MSKSRGLAQKDSTHVSDDSTTKLLVRNCEVAHQTNQSEENIPSTSLGIPVTASSDIALDDPKPYSCIKVADYMKIINDLGYRKVKIPPEKNKPPKPKSLKRVNIPLDEQVYKGLIDLKVRDEDLGINIGPVKPKEFNKPRELEPVLSDYYKAKFNREYIVKPCSPVFEVSKIWKFKGTTVLSAVNRWESFVRK